jgi:hypothetical protein
MYFAEGFRAKSDGAENQTPGYRGVLDLPGAEIANLVRITKQNMPRLIAIAHDHFINQHVVAFFDVVNTNLRIFSDLRGFNHSPI